jgi:secreted Zn-dependent insulinase-like peptidase
MINTPPPRPPQKKKKKTGWATGLSAGEAESTLDFAFFKVVIDLTAAGHG